MRKSSLPEMAEQLIYQPVEADKRMKARFWLKVQDNPLIDPATITYAQVRDLINSDSLSSKWGQPGFKDWFFNTNEHRESLEYLWILSLDAAQQILQNQDPKAQNARVALIRVMADMMGKTGGKGNSQQLGAAVQGAIAGMDKASIEMYLKKQGVDLRLSASKGQDNSITVEAETAEPTENT